MKSCRHFAAFSLAALCTALAAPSAVAADLTVRVQDGAGRLLEDAAVCAGTPVDRAQFGASYTDAGGRARFEQLPATELRVTVSKDGYRGEALPLSGVRFDRLLIVTLATGGLGPRCEASGLARTAEVGNALEVVEVAIAGLDGVDYPPAVELKLEMRGEANEYRVSENPDFVDAAWRSLEQAPVHQLSAGAGQKTLYVQVRRRASVGDGDLSIESDVASLVVSLQPPQ